MMKKVYLMLIFVFTSLFSVAQDEFPPDDTSATCFKYKFFVGDTVRYRAASFDSIIVDMEDPVMKTRYELLQVSCDSIDKEGRYLLTFELINFIGDQSQGVIKGQRINSSPWVGRKVQIKMDSLGNRFAYRSEDSLSATMSPGGAFQPQLFPPINESCHKNKRTWYVKARQKLPENGIPYPEIDQDLLMRALPPVDTLDRNCIRFSFILTAKGDFKLISPDQKFIVQTTVTGSGRMTMDSTDFVPVHFFGNNEQKFTIYYPGDDQKVGKHFISTDYTIDSLIPGPGRVKYRESLIPEEPED